MKKILIADDETVNLKLLEAALRTSDDGQNYDICKVESGDAALRAVEEFQPDLAMLDVMMPEMDGFEVCHRIKENGTFLPVVLITALNDKESRIKGMSSGADDFISKPYDPSELKLKVRNFLRMKLMYADLDQKRRDLEELQALREDLTSFIVHDLRSPLFAAQGYMDLMMQTGELPGHLLHDARRARHNIRLMGCMVSDLLDINRMSENRLKIKLEECALHDVVREALEILEPSLRAKEIEIINNVKEAGSCLTGQKDLLVRVTLNILSNAARFSPKKGIISIAEELSLLDGFSTISITDCGVGIPEDQRNRIFDKFGAVQMKHEGCRSSIGLGLTFCKMVVELHGGRIWVEDNRNGPGSMFCFQVPIAGKAAVQ